MARRSRLSATAPCASENLAEGPEEEAGKHHGDGQGKHPGHEQVAESAPLQAGAIGGHGTGDAGG